MAYVYQEFPKWKYHPSKEPVVVENADQESGLGDDWFDSPDLAQLAVARLREALLKKKAMGA